MNQTLSTTSLLSIISGISPVMRGHIAKVSSPQTDLAIRLLAHSRHYHSAAGRPYWMARSWSMLIWQPAYLSVLAVHGAQAVPSLHGLRQNITEGCTTAFSLPNEQIRRASSAELISSASTQLLQYQQQHLALLQSIMPYSTFQANCLTVDCVLSALQIVGTTQGWCAETEQKWADHWLTALQLTQHGKLMIVAQASDQQRTALERKACCQHFRLAGAQACSTCPRWPLPERVRRIQAEWQTETR